VTLYDSRAGLADWEMNVSNTAILALEDGTIFPGVL
jgi:hypothetical protein